MNSQAARWTKAALLVAAILVLVEAQFHLVRHFFRRGALDHREVATYTLAKYLNSKFSGKSAVILSNPFSTQPNQPAEVYRYEKAGIKGLQRGFGKNIAVAEIAYPEIRPEFFKDRRSVLIGAGTSTPLSYLVQDDALDRIAGRNPRAELFVSLIGLPVNVTGARAWADPSKRFALLLPDLRMVGDRRAILQAFTSGKIAAVVVNKPGAPADDAPPAPTPDAEFAARFLLITSDNAEAMLEAYPGVL